MEQSAAVILLYFSSGLDGTKPNHTGADLPPVSTPGKHHGTTVRIGLFVEDVDEVINKALKAGAIETSPAQDYEYGYRQGIIKDPFGHYWQIQKRI